MQAHQFARWLDEEELQEFISYYDGLKRKNGKSWPSDANSFARKCFYLLPIIRYLYLQRSEEKAEQLIILLTKHASRNI